MEARELDQGIVVMAVGSAVEGGAPRLALEGTQSVPCISSRRCILTTLYCVLESRTEAPSLDAHLAESRVLPSTRRNHEGIVRVLPPPPPLHFLPPTPPPPSEKV